MGGHDQSQMKIKFKKFEKKLSLFQIDVPKSHNDDKTHSGSDAYTLPIVIYF